jgi:ATP-dependent DNA helicase DinG
MLHASPVEVGHMFQSKLYEQVPSIVFTSATLSSGGGFDYFKSRLGLDGDPPPTETILDSPFDYANQTILYIPRSLPEPNDARFADALAQTIEELLHKTLGRAFILFTSHRNMELVHGKLDGKLPFLLLIQGSRPKSVLLSEFKERKSSVLFATSSFWEGVDVQGEALSCVVVDRLPFAPPNDPIVAARTDRIRKQGGDPFYSFQVPMAVLTLKQGLGRLIRTRSDRGVLCILDIRILTRSYGRIFRASLYGSPLRRDPRDIDRFFADL